MHETSFLDKKHRILIQNGRIVDGTGSQSFLGDVLIVDDKIEMIGKNLSVKDGVQVIDATGLIVAPGFIDTHSHSDLVSLIEPELLPKIMQGITTEVYGQDGVSMAPLPREYIEPWRKNIAGMDGISDEIDWTFQNTDGYLKKLEKNEPTTNQCYLLPHGNIRMEAMGLDARQATEKELERMREIVRREMEAGAIGISDGLIYVPSAYSNTEEIIEICKVAAEYNGVYVVHQRSEADNIINSMKEIIRIGRDSGIPIHFSHFKICGKNNWKYIDKIMELLDECKEEGICVSFDQYPYIAGSTTLGVILPPWAHDGGTDALLKRLANPQDRERMIYDIEHGISGWDNFVDFAGLDQIFITSVKTEKNKDTIGLSLKQLGEYWNKDAYEATFDLLLEEENSVGMVDFYGKEEHVERFAMRDEMNCCTDGILAGKPHPRAYGAFPRLLSEFVRKTHKMTLEQCIRKMTAKAAEAIHIPLRGKICVGYYADLCLFDFETIQDKGTFIDPTQYPEGIKYVLVNGQITVNEGEYTGVRSGRTIRRR